MVNYKYIKIPKQISITEYQENEYCLAPSKYSRFMPCDTVRYMSLDELCTESKKKIQFSIKNEYHYSEIGDIDVSNGSVNHSKFYGINLPSKNSKELRQGDIVISTVRTYRGGIGFIHDNLKNHCCSPAILVIRDVNKEITKEYLLSVLRTDFFIEQVLGFLNRGMYPRLDKTAMENILIPIPKRKELIEYITILTKAYNNKIQLISQKHNKILELIDSELKNNQKPNKYKFELLTIKDIQQTERLDTSLYSKDFKYWNFLVKNYVNGSKDLISRGFSWARGTSLEQGFIGTRIDSEKYHKGFYELVLPTNISQYGYVEKSTYIGTPTKLKTIEKGDIIFGGEGFGKGRTYVVIDDSHNVATNYHGIRIINTNNNLTESIFIRCFLAFWRSKGMIDFIGVGGSGGHCAPSYFHLIETPLFDDTKQKEIALLYHNPNSNYQADTFTLDNFLEQDNAFNETAGIYELDKTAKQLKEIINKAIDDIANDREVTINFNL